MTDQQPPWGRPEDQSPQPGQQPPLGGQPGQPGQQPWGQQWQPQPGQPWQTQPGQAPPWGQPWQPGDPQYQQPYPGGMPGGRRARKRHRVGNGGLSRTTMALLVPAIAVVLAVIGFVGVKAHQRSHPHLDSSGAVIGGNAPAPAPAASLGKPCYITLTGWTVTEYVYVAMASGQDCNTIAFAMQQMFYGATVTSDGSSNPAPGSTAACMGLLTAANDPSTVRTPDGSDPGGACNTLGFGPVP